MPRPQTGIGLLYHRDSLGTSERVPLQYVNWTCKKAKELGVEFDGTPELIGLMIRLSKYHERGIYLDYGVRGKELDRPGLNALVQEIKSNTKVSHLFIPRRDRLSRPIDPLIAVGFETQIRRLGVTIVYQNKILKPLRINERADVDETTKAVREFNESGEFSRALADKLIQAKLTTIELGGSIGGPAPYGFERWLADPNGERVRQLSLRERSKIPGHFVRLFPTNTQQIQVVLRIFELLKTHSCEKIAELLTMDGIEPPQAWRPDSSMVWNRQTIRNIAKSPIYTSIYEYLKTSGGEHLRMTPEGVRELEETDLNNNQKPKTIHNPPERRIRKDLKIDLVIDTQLHLDTVALLKDRRGKPRHHGTNDNPLGCRIYDYDCGWRMYRKSREGSFSYLCSAYMQSDGLLCRHHAVDGFRATKHVAKVIRQELLKHGVLEKLQNRIRELACQEQGTQHASTSLKQMKSRSAMLQKQVDIASKNLLLAESPEEMQAFRKTFKQLAGEHKLVVDQMKAMEDSLRSPSCIEKEVEAALEGVNRLRDLCAKSEDLRSISELFKMVNANLYVMFITTKKGSVVRNKVDGGVICLGASPPPVQIYQGPTDKPVVKDIIRKDGGQGLLCGRHADDAKGSQQGSERGMLGNVKRRTRRNRAGLHGE